MWDISSVDSPRSEEPVEGQMGRILVSLESV